MSYDLHGWMDASCQDSASLYAEEGAKINNHLPTRACSCATSAVRRSTTDTKGLESSDRFTTLVVSVPARRRKLTARTVHGALMSCMFYYMGSFVPVKLV